MLETTSDKYAIATENGARNVSKPTTIVGNVTDLVLLAPAPGKHLIIKGITVVGDGNQGTVKIKRETGGVTILPVYFSAQNRAGTSGALNIELGVDERVLVTATDRGTSETFIGLSYVEYH